MTIERQSPGFIVITVALSNGLTVDHRYPIGPVRNEQELERIMGPVLGEPFEAMMGISRARAFTLAYPVAVYNASHVMTLRIRGEGSSQAQEMVDQVHQMGFLARDRSNQGAGSSP